MIKQFVRTVAILCFMMLIPGIALAQVVHYVFQEYKPANYLDDQREPSGFFVDIIREAVENRLGMTMDVSVLPWMRCQALVRQGKADLMTTIPTPTRLEYAELVRVPIWIKQYRIYTYLGHPRIYEMNSIRSRQEILKAGFTVISYIGNSWSETNLENIGVTVEKSTSVEGMYRMLFARRGDILVEDPVLAADSLRSVKLENLIIGTDGLVGESAFHPLISKRSDLASRAEDFAAVLQTMWEDGTIASIMERYN